jgi:hypothetical protein
LDLILGSLDLYSNELTWSVFLVLFLFSFFEKAILYLIKD